MKARLLRKWLNDTGYHVCLSDCETKICIGSAYMSSIFELNIKSLKLISKLEPDGIYKGNNLEFHFIWNKLLQLIESGEIQQVLNGDDEIENGIPVFTIMYGRLFESVTDKFPTQSEFMNCVTKEGFTIHFNTWFRTKKEAIDYGIKDCMLGIQEHSKRADFLTKELQMHIKSVDEYAKNMQVLQEMAGQINSEIQTGL